MTIQKNKELLAKIEELQNEVSRLKKRKKYGLVWEDKPEEFDEKTKNAFPILKEKGGKFKDVIMDQDDDHNILIEGDNYHSLSVLSYTHKEKVDVIYIDPPYNRGVNDFIYNDKFIDKEDSFKHSKWLSYISKRLYLAKDLLKEDGVIFISIDDNEQSQLKLLCNDIFSESNFAGMFPWKKRTAKSDVPFGISQEFEWILCYAKSEFIAGLPLKRKYFDTPDFVNDRWRLSDLTTQKLEGERPNSAFDLKDPKTEKVFPYNPKRLWGITKDTFQTYYDNGKIVFPDDYKFLNIKIPAYRVFESEDKKKAFQKYGSESAIKSVSTFLPDGIGMSKDGNDDIYQIFSKKIFSYPKPVSLIKHILKTANKDNGTVVDFMAGSGTTGHAVMELNKEDGGNRKFILCTNNENGICEDVTYERMKRVMKGYKNAKGEKVEGLGGNMKYLKTDYVPKDVDGMVTDEDRLRLTYEAGLLLALKENTFDEVKKTKSYQIFSSAKKNVGVYFSENKEDLQKFLDDIDNDEKSVKAYIFSWDKGAYKNAFPEYEHIDFEDIPEPILEVYKQLI